MTDPNTSAMDYAKQLVNFLVVRPPFQLRSLPISCRWEVTRRHPYYLLSWKRAHAHHTQGETRDPGERLLRELAIAHLGVIGVSGLPPDPCTEVEDLESEDLNLAWLSGAMHPVSLRGVTGLLIATLPAETLERVGSLLVQASRREHENESPARVTALLELQKLDSPGLDMIPDEPIVSVNPAASGRKINEAVNALVKEWKEQRELPERRSRADKYSEYLSVWDQREGWKGGSYDPQQERKVREVASELGLPIATVNHHYRNAFELIVGHPYSPELWAQLMGPIKLSSLAIQEPGRVSRRRPLMTPTRRPVPESVLKGPSDDDTCQGPASSQADGFALDVAGLVERIRELIDQGLTNDAIVGELDLSSDAIEAVQYLRERGEDIP